MIKSIIYILLLLNVVLIAQSDSTEYKNYHWLGKNAETTISVYDIELLIPKDYKQDHWYYGEGVITTLLFSDSSLVTLHFGFTMKIPLLDEQEYLLNNKEELKDYILRKGINTKSKLFWQEHNYTGIPINIAFSNVTKEKIAVYQEVLKSIRIIKNKIE